MIWFCSEIKTGHNEIERIVMHFAFFLYHFIWLKLVFIDGFFWLEKLRKEIGFEGTKLSIYLDWSIFRTFSIEMNNWEFFCNRQNFCLTSKPQIFHEFVNNDKTWPGVRLTYFVLQLVNTSNSKKYQVAIKIFFT